MLDRLLDSLEKPALWQRSPALFWDDEHISKGMLQAHLNPDWDAASRKIETIEASVAWLGTILPPGSRVLDLGCGPGLYAGRLAKMGYAMTGMDLSQRSIDYARTQDGQSRYIVQSYLDMQEEDAYDCAIMIYCDYAALTAPERQVLLQRVHRALKSGGLFLMDVYTPAHFAAKEETTAWTAQPRGGFWSPEPHLCLDATYFYENRTVAADCTVVLTEKSVTDYIIWDTIFTRESLLAETQPGGFTLRQLWDDVCGRPYTGAAETLCALFQRA